MPDVLDDISGKNKGGPIWLQVMDRFGFPTLIALIVIGMLIVYARWAREDMATERSAFLSAIKENTKAVAGVAECLKQVERDMESNRREVESQSFELRMLRQTLTDRKGR